MPRVIMPSGDLRRVLKERRECGGDRFDEVWDGVYVMSPLADNEHQLLATKLAGAIQQSLADQEDAQVYAGTNISDQPTRWKRNFRCPDIAVFLPGNPAVDRRTHWLGGPDFAVEVLSRDDRSREKFAFYAKVGVKERLLVDRDPWRLELHRHDGGSSKLVDVSSLDRPEALVSEVLPVTIRLVPGKNRPLIELSHHETKGRWLA
jgi:Uma2 family endonuclease